MPLEIEQVETRACGSEVPDPDATWPDEPMPVSDEPLELADEAEEEI